jgi:hypothetical protein
MNRNSFPWTILPGQVQAEFTLNREAAFNNFVGFYRVADANGGIDTNGDGTVDLRPGDSGYAQAAVQGRVSGVDLTVANQGTANFTAQLAGGSLFAPFMIADGVRSKSWMGIRIMILPYTSPS